MPAAISVQAAVMVYIVSVFIHHSVWRWIKRGHTNTEKGGKLLKKEFPSLRIFLKISKLTREECRSECVCVCVFTRISHISKFATGLFDWLLTEYGAWKNNPSSEREKGWPLLFPRQAKRIVFITEPFPAINIWLAHISKCKYTK